MNSGKRKRGARVRKRRKENIRKGVVRVRDTETGKPNFDINTFISLTVVCTDERIILVLV